MSARDHPRKGEHSVPSCPALTSLNPGAQETAAPAPSPPLTSWGTMNSVSPSLKPESSLRTPPGARHPPQRDVVTSWFLGPGPLRGENSLLTPQAAELD